MKLNRLIFASFGTPLLAVGVLGQGKPVSETTLRADVPGMVKRLTGRQDSVRSISQSGKYQIVHTQSAVLYFSPDDPSPILGRFDRSSTNGSAKRATLSQTQVLSKALGYARALQFDVQGLRRRIVSTQSERVRSSNASSFFVYFDQDPEGIPAHSSAMHLEIQIDRFSGELIAFNCRRSVILIGGKALPNAVIDKMVSAVLGSEKILAKSYVWKNANFFESTRNRAASSNRIIKILSVQTSKRLYYFRADNGKLVGTDSVR